MNQLLRKTPKAAAHQDFRPSWRLERLPGASGQDGHVLVSAEDRLGPGDTPTRLHTAFDDTCKRMGKEAARRVAIDYGEVSYSYADLQRRANRLARFLQAQGVVPGSVVALLLERSIDLYASVLALSRLRAAFVPLDAAFPTDRIAFIVQDSAAQLIVTLGRHVPQVETAGVPVLPLDDHFPQIARCSARPFAPVPGSGDPLAYVIYTSGTTGQPKGVPIRQGQIGNFLHVAAAHYGYLPTDRVYQSLTVAFDYSFEEIWVPLLSGATLVPAPPEGKLVGEDLHDFLTQNRITAMCVVPTLLGTLKPDLPDLRFLMVSGEACPPDLIEPWFAPGRRILNVYGPTETTVTATWSVLEPGQPITIGGPLPTYAILVIDPDTGEALGAGVAGEICIAGRGVFDGYLNRPDQTAKALSADDFGLPDNPGGRIYHTGDLGRITATGEIEYLGRIDTQVKIRGFRIELGEIEALARGVPGIGQAVVEPYEPEGQDKALVAYLTPQVPGVPVDVAAVDAVLRAALPDYMVPSFYEPVDSIPMLASDKVNRRALPRPTRPRFTAGAGEIVAPRTDMETKLAQLLAETLKVEEVSVEADFFDDLGADSLKLASYVTAIRKQLGIRRITMRKLYEQTTIATLAALLEGLAEPDKPRKKAAAPQAAPEAAPQAAATAAAAAETVSGPVATATATAVDLPPAAHPGEVAALSAGPAPDTRRHVPTAGARLATGIAQVLVYAASVFAVTYGAVHGYEWAVAATGLLDLYLRTVVATAQLFLGTSLALIAVKWIAVGRFTDKPIPIYSLAYLRFWIAQRAIHSNPLVLFAGTPLYAVYLRLLGMSVGPDTVILAPPPVCTDLISVGARTVIRHDCVFQGYTSENGYIYPGRIDIGADVLICEATVLDIETAIGDGSQLGTTSALLRGQEVPPGAIWQGSPAEPSASNFDRVEPRPVSRVRKVAFALTNVASLFLLTLPGTIIGGVYLANHGMDLTGYSFGTGAIAALESLGLAAAIIYFGGILAAIAAILVVPRLLNLFVVPEESHPIYGVQYELARAISRTSNNPLLNTIFGDSSMIVHWLSLVGYDLRKSTQTGSNFGVEQRHHSPFLCSFDRNTLVSDGLYMMNMETSATAFRLRQVSMPPDTYVGNDVHYPADSRLGPNCLIATKAAVPVDGPVRADVGLLGSPAFEIPRSVVRDQRFDHFKMPGIFEQRLRMKLRSNLGTLGLYLLRSWLLTAFGLGLVMLGFAVLGSDTVLRTALALTVSSLAFVFVAAVFSIFSERLDSGFKALEPRYCSLYDPQFWTHERFWKLNYNAFLIVFNGTPMKPFFLRLQGAKVGRGVFDDGAGLTEPSLTEIGDDCTLNYRVTLQCHSLEDGTFKSDRIRLGRRCTVGVGGFVHYGAQMQDDSTLGADAFLMKGTLVEAGTRWIGNPARDEATRTLPAFTMKGAQQ